MDVSLIPGEGIVSRDERFLTWSADDSLDVMAQVCDAGDGAFKALAALVLEKDFDASPFVVVDFERESAFIFGSAVLWSPGGVFDGATTSTWVETKLEDLSDLAVNADAGEADVVTRLVEGTVRAGGWLMVDVGTASGQITESMADPEEAAEAPHDEAEGSGAVIEAVDSHEEHDAIDDLPEAALEDGDADEALPSESEEVPSEISDSITDEPQGVEILVPPASSNVENDDVDFLQDDDALDDEAPIASDEEGQSESLTIDLLEDDTEDVADPFAGDLTVVASSIGNGPPTVTFDGEPPEVPDFPSEEEAGLAAPPLRSPGTPRLRSQEVTDDDMSPSPRSRSVSVHFDDGQSVELDRGLYVGRHPTKNGLPVGYSSVTIRGEHVSRVHWEIDLSGEMPVIRDLGSMSGLLLQAEGLDPMEIASNGEAALAGTVRVEFADRWAEIDLG